MILSIKYIRYFKLIYFIQLLNTIYLLFYRIIKIVYIIIKDQYALYKNYLCSLWQVQMFSSVPFRSEHFTYRIFSMCTEKYYIKSCHISTFPASVTSTAIQHNSTKALTMKQTSDANTVLIQFQQ